MMIVGMRILTAAGLLITTTCLAQRSTAEDSALPTLHAAAASGDVREVKKLIQGGADLDVVVPRGRTPLVFVAEKGHVEVLRLLLEAGADPNQDTKEQKGYGSAPPLNIAVWGRNEESVKLLLIHGADVNKVHTEPGFGTVFEESPLHVAVHTMNLSMVRLMLDQGADANLGLISGDLHFRLVEGKRESEHHGQTPLHIAAEYGYIDIANRLIHRGADVNVRTHSGQSPLGLAVDASRIEMVEFLVKHGADIKTEGEHLLPAATARSLKLTRLLVDKGANLGERGQAAALTAAGAGRLEILKYLHEQGVPIRGWKLLAAAADRGSLQTVQWLLEKGCKINPPDDGAGSALTSVADNYHLHLPLLTFLLDNGAKIDRRTSEGHTALNELAIKGHTKGVRLLLERGADPHIKTNSGSTPSNAAAFWGYQEVVAMLLKVEDLERTGSRLLHDTMYQSHVGLARYLIETGFDVNARNDRGQTPLHLAAFTGVNEKNRAQKMREFLIAKGADLNAKDMQGRTPLEVAEAHGIKEAAKQIRSHMSKGD